MKRILERRAVRIALISLGWTAVAAALLIALGPTLIAKTIGPSLLRDAIAKQVSGEVHVRGLSLGWFGEQRIESLSIVEGPKNSIFASAVISGGLLHHWWTGFRTFSVTLHGDASSTLDGNSQLGIVGMLTAKQDGPPAKGSADASHPPALPKGLDVALDLSGLRLWVEDTARRTSYVLSGLDGDIHLTEAEGTLTAKLAGTSEVGGRKGSVKVDAVVRGLGGEIAVQKIGMDLSFEASKLRAPVGERTAEIDSLSIEVKAKSLGEPMTVKARGLGSIAAAKGAGGAAGAAVKTELVANLGLGRLFDRKGAFVFSPATVAGSLTASNIPISLIAPFGGLGGAMSGATSAGSNPIEQFVGSSSEVIERCTIECTARTSPASRSKDQKGAPTIADLRLTLVAPRAKVEANATVEGARSIRDGTLTATLSLDRATLTSWLGVEVAAGAAVQVTGEQLAWNDPTGEANPIDAAAGRILIETLNDARATDIRPASAEVDESKLSFLVAKGATVTVDCRDAKAPIRATLAARVGYAGGELPASAPPEPNVVAAIAIDRSFTTLDATSVVVDLPLDGDALRRFLPDHTIDGGANLVVEVPSARVPLSAKGAEAMISEIAASARVRVRGELRASGKGLPHQLRVGEFEANLASDRLEQGATIQVSATVDGAKLALDGTIAGIPALRAPIDPLALVQRADLTIGDAALEALTSWAPDAAAFARRLGLADGVVNIALAPAGDGAVRRSVTVEAGLGAPVKLALAATLDTKGARVESLAVKARVTPQVAAKLVASENSAADDVDRLELAAPVELALTLEQPVELPFDALAEGRVPGATVRLVGDEVSLRAVPGLRQPITIRGLSLVAAADGKGESISLVGGFAASGSAAEERIEKVVLDLTWKPADMHAGTPLLKGLRGVASAEGISVAWLERLVGQPASAISAWTGANGSLRAELGADESGERVRLTPSFPHVSGGLGILASGDSVELTASGLSVSVPAAELSAMQSRSAANGAVACEFAKDLVVDIPTAKVRLPHGLHRTMPPLGDATVELEANIGAVDVRVPVAGGASETLGVPPLRLTVESRDLTERIGFALRADGAAGGAAKGTRVSASGEARGLLDGSGTLALDGAAFALDTDVRDLPTALVEVFAGTGGGLARKIGDRLTLKARAASASRGTRSVVSADLSSEYLDIKAPSVSIEKGRVRLADGSAIDASFALSPGIKDDLLYAINPLFGDIALENKRATFQLTSLNYPLDGDLATLDADFQLNVGDVKLSGDKPICILFALIKGGFTPGAEARVEPLAGRVRGGRLTYQDFGLKLFRNAAAQQGGDGSDAWKVSVAMQGDIRLASKPMHVDAISAAIPLSVFVDAAGQATRLIGGIGGLDSDVAKKVSVGVTMYGDLHDAQGNPKPLEQKITVPGLEEVLDPKNLLKWGIKEGAGRGLEGIIPKP